MRICNKTIFRYLFVFIACIFVPFSYAQQDKGFLWEVSGGKGKVYLLGSLHFATKNFYPLRQEIQRAFSQSRNLVVEIDINKLHPQYVQNLITEQGIYPNSETLKDHISPKAYQRILEYYQKSGLPPIYFAKHRPGMLVMTMTSMELGKLGMSPEYGIDLYFTTQARGQKNILELETLKDQLDLIINLDDGEQLLMQTLDEFKEYPALTNSLINSWKTGDTDLLNYLLVDKPLREYPESSVIYDKMIIQRNYKMVDKIKRYLKSGDSYFIVVGAGHMIGKDGIVDLLEKAGYPSTRR